MVSVRNNREFGGNPKQLTSTVRATKYSSITLCNRLATELDAKGSLV